MRSDRAAGPPVEQAPGIADKDGGGSDGPRGDGNPLVRAVSFGYRKLFVEQWQVIDADAAVERAALGDRFDARPMWVMIVAGLICVFQEYYGDRPTFDLLFPSLAHSHYGQLGELAYWTLSKVLGYFIVPAIAVRMTGLRLRDCGLTFKGVGQHFWIYLVLFGAILPVIVAISYTPPFLRTYPFYRQAMRSWFDLVSWELLYALSFFALEFFFRGFLLFALRRPFGHNAIFVMVVPYCMIHFHKPVPETVGAIFAGVVLGTLAMRTRSIWCGVLIHVSVAWSMDLLALTHASGFPQGVGRYIG